MNAEKTTWQDGVKKINGRKAKVKKVLFTMPKPKEYKPDIKK